MGFRDAKTHDPAPATRDRVDSLVLRYVAKSILWLGGWTPVGEHPTLAKAVIIGAPHTSNWDAFWALTYKVSIGLDVHFFGKHTVFWFPLGLLLRSLGGIPLDRDEPGSAVDKAVRAFAADDRYFFGLAPEGTRARRPHWKSGFYRIALKANVPVILGFFDFGSKRIGLGPTIELSGNSEQDMARIREFYSGVTGRHPENASPVTLDDV